MAHDQAFVDELDQRIGELGAIGWELGPGLTTFHALVLSPGGSRDMVALKRNIVERAPQIGNREFHSAKLPKSGWNLLFDLSDAQGNALVTRDELDDVAERLTPYGGVPA